MSRAVVSFMLVALTAAFVPAQPRAEAQMDFDRVAREQQVQQRVEALVEMGIEREAALFLTLLGESGMEPSQIVLMMMMAEHGGQEMLPLMLMNRGPGQAAPPAVIDRGEELLIVEGGTLYVVDMTTNEVKSKLKYATPERFEDTAIFPLLVPMMAGGRDHSQQDTCLSNLKQIGLAFMLHAQDDGVVPEDNWVASIMHYTNNAQVFTCPSRPNLPVGYALNEKLIGVDLNALTRRAEVPLLFESNIGGDAPVGGPADVPEEGVHNGGIGVLFADGHAQWLPVEAAIDRLTRPLD
ncbi:MAG: hypothetical protein ACOX9R_17575 [Armatimonadota bacterium]|jgi:prepilin-type processing-associated H-X9-DG protein